MIDEKVLEQTLTLFIGQKALKPKIRLITTSIANRENLNVLLSGPSGYGKTYLAKLIANFSCEINDEYASMWTTDDAKKICPTRRINIVDEIHLIKNIELIYPYLDVGRYTFLMCSNEISELKEPLVNRCIQIYLDSYLPEELEEIVKYDLSHYGVSLKEDDIKIIASRSRGSPRSAGNICLLLSRGNGKVFNLENDVGGILNSLGILDDGFTVADLNYLDTIKNGRMSIDSISGMLHLPKSFVVREIEPFLLHKNLIKITSRGRELV